MVARTLLCQHVSGALFNGLPISAQPAPSRGSRKPSIILISIDTLRADHLSCYSPSAPKTPNIDKIAQGGTLFWAVNSLSQSIQSSPLLKTLLTVYRHCASPTNARSPVIETSQLPI